MMDHFERSSLNCFAAHAIDRVSHKRHDEAWVARRLEDPSTRILPVWRAKNLFADEPALRPVLLPPTHLGDLLHQAESITLLGQADGRAFFALGLCSGGDGPAPDLAKLGPFRDLRTVGGLLPAGDASLLAYARAMAHWHHEHRFCGCCGSPAASADGGHLRVCTNPKCGQQHFPRTDPAVIVRVTAGAGERCLLGRQAAWPPKMHSIIAGFVEPGESLETAVVRELREETGIRIREIRYFSSQPWPFPRSLMLGFTAQAASEEIQLNDGELEGARWFSREDIVSGLENGTLRLPSNVSISHRLIEAWFDAGGLGRLGDIASEE